MPKIFSPSNQIKLTNVSVVRLKRNGKRYEIACYKNKVVEYRNGIETDLDNVLQSHSVFVNVSKGQLSNEQDLLHGFQTTDKTSICIQILKKGELQVSEKERSIALESTVKDIITYITETCINPTTKRPYTMTMIEKSIGEIQFNIQANKPTKVQAKEIIQLLQAVIPIIRAMMHVKVTVTNTTKLGKQGKELVQKAFQQILTDEWSGSGEWCVTGLIDPGQYKVLLGLVESKGQIDVLNLSQVMVED